MKRIIGLIVTAVLKLNSMINGNYKPFEVECPSLADWYNEIGRKNNLEKCNQIAKKATL